MVDARPGPKYAKLELATGKKIHAVRRRGKFIILELSDGWELIIHLGMTGIVRPDRPEKHLRVELELSGDDRLYFQDSRRFGRFLLVPQGDYHSLPTLRGIGPEPFSDAFSPEYFRAALQKSAGAVKSYLLSQKPVAGLGNIYADEVLWLARVHPLSSSKSIPHPQINELRQHIIQVLAASIEAQGTTLKDYRSVNGNVGEYVGQLEAYGRHQKPCKRCGAIIQRLVIAQRSSHCCEVCQQRF